MQSQQAVLVDGSRLMRDFIKHIIETKANFEVVRELGDPQELSSAIKETNAEWVFLILHPDLDLSKEQLIELLLERPSLRIVLLNLIKGHIEVEWLVHGHKDLAGVTLEELTDLLREEWKSSQVTS